MKTVILKAKDAVKIKELYESEDKNGIHRFCDEIKICLADAKSIARYADLIKLEPTNRLIAVDIENVKSGDPYANFEIKMVV